VRDEGGRPPGTLVVRQPFERRDLSALDASDRRDAGDPGSAVDPDGAAAALALRAAPVLDRSAAELVAQCVEEGDPVIDADLVAVEDEGNRWRTVRGRAGRAARSFGGGVAQGARCAEAPRLS
jgi:hypothetical protein